MLKHINKIFVICLILASVVAVAQPKGAQPLVDTKTFQAELAKANSKVLSLKSDFLQNKKMELLEENIKSEGKFYFKKEDRIRIEYTKPYTYLVVLDGNKLTIKDEEKVSKINTRGSKMMQSVNRVIVDCMKGTVLENSDFNTKVFTNKGSYELIMVPVDNTMKQLFQRIEVSMKMNSFNVHRISMIEQGGDATVMIFSNIKQNTPVDESLFKIN